MENTQVDSGSNLYGKHANMENMQVDSAVAQPILAYFKKCWQKRQLCSKFDPPIRLYLFIYNIYIKVEPQTLSVKLHILHTYSITGVTDNK